MRWILPAMIVAFLATGCASHQCKHEKTEPEAQPAVDTAKPVPLLSEIPILGPSFRQQDEPAKHADKEVAAAVPLLSDIPILGFMFRRVDKEDSDK